jgi:hypothetical protein
VGLRPACHPNYTRNWKIVSALADYLGQLATPEDIETVLDGWSRDDERKGQIQVLDGLATEIDGLKEQRKRLALDRAGGAMDAQMYRETDNVILKQLEARQARRVETERALEALPNLDRQRKILEHLAANFPALVERTEPPEMSQLLMEGGLRVWCEDTEAVAVERGDW